MLFNARKTKRITNFDGLESRRCEDIKGIVTPEIDYGTSENKGLFLESPETFRAHLG